MFGVEGSWSCCRGFLLGVKGSWSHLGGCCLLLGVVSMSGWSLSTVGGGRKLVSSGWSLSSVGGGRKLVSSGWSLSTVGGGRKLVSMSGWSLLLLGVEESWSRCLGGHFYCCGWKEAGLDVWVVTSTVGGGRKLVSSGWSLSSAEGCPTL